VAGPPPTQRTAAAKAAAGDGGDPAATPARPEAETLTALPGVRVGHWSDPVGRTGCTVVLFDPPGAVTSGLVLGAAPGSREIALLAPEKTIERVHALVLAGGSAFGLDAASGVVRYLEERGVGFPTPFGVVPIVPAAVLFDLSVGDRARVPTPRQGTPPPRRPTAGRWPRARSGPVRARPSASSRASPPHDARASAAP
jgi:L-aminopeptidase/D-esterase-like protein